MDLQEIYKALRSEYNGKTWSDEFMRIHVTLMRDGQVICWFDLDKEDEGFEEKRDCAISFYDEVVKFLVDSFGEEFKYEDPRISGDYIDKNNMYGQYEIVLDDDGENAPVIAIWENEENEMKPRFNESYDERHMYKIFIKDSEGYHSTVHAYGYDEDDAIENAMNYNKIGKNDKIEKVVDLGERKLVKEYGRKVYPAANGCTINDMGDCFIVTNKMGLNIGQCKSLIEAEHIAENADEYTAKKLGYSESKKKLVKEGAGAGYTVEIKGLKFGKIVDYKLEKGEKSWEDSYKVKVEVVPGEYEIAANDYYDDFFWQEHEFGDTPEAQIDGGYAIFDIALDGNPDEDDEALFQMNRELENRKLDISFDYGWGWTHVNLPREEIELDERVDIDEREVYFGIDKLVLNAPDLADAVNCGFQSTFDQGEEDEEEVDESRYMSDDDIAGQYKGWWFSEFGPVEVDRDRLDASAWIEFPSADGEDFDSGRGLWFVKGMDEDDYPRELNDVWMEPDTAREVKEVARDLMNAKVKYLSFKSAEEFHKYMDEFKPMSNENGELMNESLEEDWHTVTMAFDEFNQKLWNYSKQKNDERLAAFRTCSKKCEKALRDYYNEVVYDGAD